MDTKVAIIIPTMNRSDFILRQFEFYKLVNNPHPLYISDSSNEENAKKIKDSIKRFKNLKITYQWVPSGKDYISDILPLIKEKYCIQMGDDDLIIPKTISKCAVFLEDHSEYATCTGRQVNIRLRREDYNKPYGVIERQTRPFGRSFEDEDLFVRVRNFWSDPTFICFSVTRTETEKAIRNITKHFYLMDYVTEFVLWSVPIIYGKSKTLDELGYIMQISDNRHPFIDYPGIDYIMSSPVNEKWGVVLDGLSTILQEFGKSKEEGLKMAKWIFTLYFIYQFTLNASALFPPGGQEQSLPAKRSLLKKVKHFLANRPLFKSIYYKLSPPDDVIRPESPYFEDFKIVKNFLEKDQ